MAKTVTLEVSDNLYELLLQVAGQVEQTPEQLLVEWIEHKIKQSLNDPLLQLAGAFESVNESTSRPSQSKMAGGV